MPQITLFDPNGKGKKSDNAPCVVNIPEISFDSLPADVKQQMIDKFIKSEAVAKYNRLAKGFVASKQLLEDSKSIIAGFSSEVPSDEQLKGCAVLLGKQRGIEVSFEPVTSFDLSVAEVLNNEEPDEE